MEYSIIKLDCDNMKSKKIGNKRQIKIIFTAILVFAFLPVFFYSKIQKTSLKNEKNLTQPNFDLLALQIKEPKQETMEENEDFLKNTLFEETQCNYEEEEQNESDLSKSKTNWNYEKTEVSQKPSFTGLDKIDIELGEPVQLREGVHAYDASLKEVLYTYDDTNVFYDQPGTYTIIYKAVDTLKQERVAIRTIEIHSPNETVMISNFPTYNQYPKYPNGCESVALYNLLRYYQVDVSVDAIIKNLKKGKSPYTKNNKRYGGNPEIEFVGDPRKQNGYGVYQKPILKVASLFKEGMIDYTGHTLEEVLDLVKQGIPVQVWVSIHLQNTKVCATWTYSKTKEKIKWICRLHSVVVIGYNKEEVYVSDSYTGKIESYSRKQFKKIYNLFGKRAIYYPE